MRPVCLGLYTEITNMGETEAVKLKMQFILYLFDLDDIKE